VKKTKKSRWLFSTRREL